ncbi:sugar phosphate nucleotidyltransferase [Rhizobium ruizarguesonis]|uniref:phosphocholine cytidylyltransferase family protein n=1 Tax=Rhizobium ruizarguesonis TaxID=2081791 RepID=UPI0037199F2E
MSYAFPDKAVILAAGFGSRLRPLTDLRPKPLIEVNGTPILYNALRNLEAVGVREATIVVGYRKDAIQYACGHRFGGVEINYVESAVFDRTGSAFSLWLARETLLRGDCYIIEGDVFFETAAVTGLKEGGPANVAAVAPFEASMEGSAVVLSHDGFLSEIRLKQSAKNLAAPEQQLFKTLNLMSFCGQDLRSKIVPALVDLIGSGEVKAYTEELLAHLIARRGLRVAAVRCDDLKWYEIDSQEDLRVAEEIFRDHLPLRAQRGRAVDGASLADGGQ